jgi:hypothetical protein
MNNKKCPKCKEVKDIESFCKTNIGIKSGRCKACQKEIGAKHYIDNRDIYLSRGAERRKSCKNVTDKAKDKPCMDCGISYPSYVMDFDHRDQSEKEFTIGTAAGKGIKIERLEEEIKKCDVVCSNCHRERTYLQQQNIKNK